MKPVVMLPEQWDRVWEEIKKREKPSTILSRSKMREVLGFTNRVHEEHATRDQLLRTVSDQEWDHMIWFSTVGDRETVFQRTVHLDFYDEHKRVMFLLKYGDYLDVERN